MERLRLEADLKISEAKREIIKWTVTLITLITGGWTVLILAFLNKQ